MIQDVGLLFGLLAFVFYQTSNVTFRQIGEIYRRRKSCLPGWIFGIVWTLLYVALVISGYYSFTDDQSSVYFVPQLVFFIINLYLNKMWSRTFFDGQHEADEDEQSSAISQSLWIIILMDLTGIVVLVFMGILHQWVSFGLYGAYVVWVGIATVLNINWLFSSSTKEVLPTRMKVNFAPKLPRRTLLKAI